MAATSASALPLLPLREKLSAERTDEGAAAMDYAAEAILQASPSSDLRLTPKATFSRKQGEKDSRADVGGFLETYPRGEKLLYPPRYRCSLRDRMATGLFRGAAGGAATVSGETGPAAFEQSARAPLRALRPSGRA